MQAFYEDLSGRQYVNEVFNFSVDKLYDLLFTTSPFLQDFMEAAALLWSDPWTGPSLTVHPFLHCISSSSSSFLPTSSHIPFFPQCHSPLSGLP